MTIETKSEREEKDKEGGGERRTWGGKRER